MSDLQLVFFHANNRIEFQCLPSRHVFRPPPGLVKYAADPAGNIDFCTLWSTAERNLIAKTFP